MSTWLVIWSVIVLHVCALVLLVVHDFGTALLAYGMAGVLLMTREN